MTQTCKIPATPRAAAACCRSIDGLLEVALFRALGDATRLRLFSCLVKCARPCSVSEIAECCDVDLSVVSRHLRTLADAGVIVAEKEGRTVSYTVAWERLAATLRALAVAIEECCAGGRPAVTPSKGKSHG